MDARGHRAGHHHEPARSSLAHDCGPPHGVPHGEGEVGVRAFACDKVGV